MSDPRKTIEIKAGAILIKEGDTDRKMFIIKAGKVRVFKEYMGKKIVIATLGEGEIFGELSFFDSKPRSASVEAITNVSLITIDATDKNTQLGSLPPWVSTILKTVFFRFREADQKLTVLQNVNSGKRERKSKKEIVEELFKELKRFNSAFLILNEKSSEDLSYDDYYDSLESILVDPSISIGTYFKELYDYHFIVYDLDDSTSKVVVNETEIKRFSSYIDHLIKLKDFKILSIQVISLFKHLISEIPKDSSRDKNIHEIFDQDFIESIPIFQDCVEELQELTLLSLDPTSINLTNDQLHEMYTYHSIFRKFLK